MKLDRFHKRSRLALRLALYCAGLIGLVNFIFTYWIFDLGLAVAAWPSVILALTSFLLIYLILHRMVYRRLERLNEITRNILRKRFRDYENMLTGNRDELDFLIKQTIKASKTVEREIQRLNRIENYRKEFIGDISHELKTPIFAIQGFVETLLNGAIEDEEVNRRFLEKAMRNINRLIYLTNDLMEISKLETGELKSSMQPLNLHNVVADVVESMQFKASDEGVILEMGEIGENLLVNADRNQIKQVLVNLIENAIKYNKPGGQVKVGVKTDTGDKRRVEVYVRDTGIGIEPRYIDRVTERFFRIDKSRSREKGGTGLGLAIVKHIMEAHGEEFRIESNPNQGSTVSFTLTKAERKPVSA